MNGKKKGPPSSSLQRQNKLIRSYAKYFPSEYSHEHDAIGYALLSVSSYLTLGSQQAGEARSEGVDHSGDESTGTTMTPVSNVTFPIEEALERVAVWKTRSSRIAHAIESTAALAQIVHRESIENNSSDCANQVGTKTTTTELRHAYACAILRAVNGLADTLQQQRSSAASIAVLCAELGVPPWLVAIRHEATHNQLPPLVTLRMAAHALLQYFSTVYWAPITRRRQKAIGQAKELLQNYDTAAEDEGQTRADKRQKQCPDEEQHVDTVESDSDSSSTGSSSEDDHVDEAPMSDDLWQSAPGTTSNRFSILSDDKPSKRRLSQPTTTRPTPRPTRQTELPVVVMEAKSPIKARGDNESRTAALFGLAQQYVSTYLPIDVMYQMALDYFVLGSKGETERGKMVSYEYAVTVERLRPILTVMGRTWPGFLSALLAVCVDTICIIQPGKADASADATPVLEATTLLLWIRYLLSRKFLCKVYNWKAKKDYEVLPTDGGGRHVDSSVAPLFVLKKLQFPINRLCDRLVHTYTEHNEQFPECKRLIDLFCDILGPERVAHNGANAWEEPRVAPGTPVDTPLVAESHPQTKDSTSLSLEDMEAIFLSGEFNATGTDDVPVVQDDQGKDERESNGLMSPSPHPTVVRWVRCNSWEPCALGARL